MHMGDEEEPTIAYAACLALECSFLGVSAEEADVFSHLSTA